jgi:hypothetical protein
MKKTLVLLAALAFASAAAAQQFKWVDKDGKVRYGDTPPPGAAASSIRAPSHGATSAPAATDGKGAKAGPLTEAEKEQAFRKRQADAAKAAEKADSERHQKEEQAQNCARIQENLRSLESGQRIMRVNAAGERYYLDEAQMAQEAANVRRSMQQACK